MDEVPVIPLYFYTRVYLMNPKVQGWWPNILDIHPYKYVSIGDGK
jgi:ABC-type transport system substrate-binding protein